MNIAFFLTPKQDVAVISDDSTIRQALEKMEYHRFSAVPIIGDHGEYIGTIREGDILWELKSRKALDFMETEKILIKDVKKHLNNKAISINSDIKEAILLAVDQSFVPVVDDNKVFIGILKRSDIIKYCYDNLFDVEKNKPNIRVNF